MSKDFALQVRTKDGYFISNVTPEFAEVKKWFKNNLKSTEYTFVDEYRYMWKQCPPGKNFLDGILFKHQQDLNLFRMSFVDKLRIDVLGKGEYNAKR